MTVPDLLALGGQQDDAALRDAERRLASLRQERDAIPPEEGDRYSEMTDRIFEAYKTISRTAPTTLAGAAIKLRLLLDRHLGIDVEMSHDDFKSLEQISEFVEHEAQRLTA